MKKVRKFFLPDYDTHFEKWFAATDENYQMRDLLAAIPHLTNYRTALDVGACVGFHTRILETIFNNVYAFEPDPLNMDHLIQNVNPVLETTLLLYALGSKTGKEKFNRGVSNCGATKLSPEGTDGIVDIKTIDEFNFQFVDFIKIDVEGMEKEVLIGSNDTIRRCNPVIYVENSEPNSLEKFFHKLNYSRVYSRNLEEIYAPNK